MKESMYYETFTEAFAYYDRTAMKEYFEQKALEGWQLCRKEMFSKWVFKRIEPKKLHYAITYLPQFSNEDSFLLSENKKEYLEFCAEQGWQFACVYKNMVVFYNEEENPVPFETDPEVELAAIHKSMMKHSLIKLTLVFAGLAGLIFYFFLKFNDDPIKFFFSISGKVNTVILFIMIFVCFNLSEFISYCRWRKKAVAAASLGDFTKTEFSDKLFTAFLVIMTVLYVAVIFITTILSGNLAGLWLLGFGAIYVFLSAIVDNEKEKSQGKKRKALSILSFVMLFVLVVAGDIVKTHYENSDSSYTETYISDDGYEQYVYKDDIPLKIEALGLAVDSKQYSYELTNRKSAIVVITEASQTLRTDVENYYDLPHLNYTVYEIKWQFLLERSLADILNDNGLYGTYEQTDETVWKAEKAYKRIEFGIDKYNYLLCYDGKLVEFVSSWEITPEQAAVVAETLG